MKEVEEEEFSVCGTVVYPECYHAKNRIKDGSAGSRTIRMRPIVRPTGVIVCT